MLDDLVSSSVNSHKRSIIHKAASTMACISEDRIDLIEEKMRSKIDTMTGFSDVEGKSRALEKVRHEDYRWRDKPRHSRP